MFERVYTKEKHDPFTDVRWSTVAAENGLEYIAPAHWSPAALEVFIAQHMEKDETEVRTALQRTTKGLANSAPFLSPEEKLIFADELCYLLVHQKVALDGVRRVSSFNVQQKHTVERVKAFGKQLALEGALESQAITLPIDHAESQAFIQWKQQEELSRAALALGQEIIRQAANRIIDACDRDSFFGFDPERNTLLRRAVAEVKQAGVGEEIIRLAIGYAEQGYEEFPLHRAEEALSEDKIKTVVALDDDFIEAALTGHSVTLRDRGEEVKTALASDLWEQLLEAMWASGEPELVFTGSSKVIPHISASGGVMFRNGSVTPAATLNIMAFQTSSGTLIDMDALQHAVTITCVALELLHQDSAIALSLTNIAPLLMANAVAYDSDEGRTTSALLTALFSGLVYQSSSTLAGRQSAFEGYEAQEEAVLQRIKSIQLSLNGKSFLQEGMMRRPIDMDLMSADKVLLQNTKQVWETAYALCREHGLRHAHLTSMDSSRNAQVMLNAQAQNIAPVSSLVVFQDGGEYGKVLNPVVNSALTKLGYTTSQIEDINFYILGHGTLLDAPAINHATLKEKGFGEAQLSALETALTNARHIRYAFNPWVLGEEFYQRLMPKDETDMLLALGFSEEEIECANAYTCGAMTIEGAPHLLLDHLAVFDCITTEGTTSIRHVSLEAQIKMQSALERFLSGGVAHVLHLDHHASIEDIKELVLLAWESGAKQVKLYRDGCSVLSPAMIPVEAIEIVNNEEIETCQKQYINV